MNTSYTDVVIIGAGLSGIGAAYHLQAHSPDQSYAIFESRTRIGGTWDLFRYPGIRSDSDMYTFGFKFKPWVHSKAISPGKMIREYIEEAAVENGIVDKIEFSSRVTAVRWNSSSARWTISVQDVDTGNTRRVQSRFIFMCGGYYRYDEGYLPAFKGIDDFKGTVIHPQHWPEKFDVANKRIAIIGSGATAVTLAPTLAQSAQHVTLVQRSPTYIFSRPSVDPIARWAQRWLRPKLAYGLVRWKNILMGSLAFWYSRKRPERMKKFLAKGVNKHLNDEAAVAEHFTPTYNPWDQRICLVPDGDLFEAINQQRLSVVTDEIDTVLPDGLRLKSGKIIEADTIVTATGLKIEVFSGIKIHIDDQLLKANECFSYKGMMLSGVPNMAFSIGYTNASWTLKSDLVGEYVSRLLNYLRSEGYDYCVPKIPQEGLTKEPLMDFTSGYIKRAENDLPHQGRFRPWRLYQNYVLDRWSLGHGSLQDSAMEFVRSDRKKSDPRL